MQEENDMSIKIEIPEYKGVPIALEAHGIRYGFRYDPMEFIENDRTWRGAYLRTMVLGQPADGDRELLDARGNENPVHAATLGCSADHPKLKEFLDNVRGREPEELDPYDLQVLCLIGGNDPAVAEKRTALLDRVIGRAGLGDKLRRGCPWTPGVHLKALWYGRPFDDRAADAMEPHLAWVADGMNEAGCVSYKCPWGCLELAGSIDHPVSRQIVLKQIPMLLRAQQPDGSFDGRWALLGGLDRTTAAYQALTRCGLLDQLRALPPLPPDWRVVRSIPPPEGHIYGPVWNDGLLWVIVKGTEETLGLSPTDGAIVERLPIKGLSGAWDGCLATPAGNKITQHDPGTGEVKRVLEAWPVEWADVFAQINGQLWIADPMGRNAAVYDLEKETWGRSALAATLESGGVCMTPAGDGIWHNTVWNTLAKSSVDVELAPGDDPLDIHCQSALLDFGDLPFGLATTGIAHDGENLWALDQENKRICIIEKTESGEEIAEGLMAERRGGQ